jgi:hypothetical protein
MCLRADMLKIIQPSDFSKFSMSFTDLTIWYVSQSPIRRPKSPPLFSPAGTIVPLIMHNESTTPNAKASHRQQSACSCKRAGQVATAAMYILPAPVVAILRPYQPVCRCSSEANGVYLGLHKQVGSIRSKAAVYYKRPRRSERGFNYRG